jgi:hypothetical protein
MTRYTISSLTVLATDANGEVYDLNAEGAPCRNREELAAFVRQLADVGAYDDATRDALLAEIK